MKHVRQLIVKIENNEGRIAHLVELNAKLKSELLNYKSGYYYHMSANVDGVIYTCKPNNTEQINVQLGRYGLQPRKNSKNVLVVTDDRELHLSDTKYTTVLLEDIEAPKELIVKYNVELQFGTNIVVCDLV